MMAQQRVKSKAEDVTPTPPETQPSGPFYGHGMDVGFVWQQLSDMQRTLGAIQEAQKQLSGAQEKFDSKTSSKLAAIESELTSIRQIKHTAKWVITIAAVVGGLLLTAAGYIVKEVWTISKPIIVEKLTPPKQVEPKP